ncbi:uncharacterized protein B0H64DRAFT_18948 [Chaetomium fimeti]|uniref:WSC domain-containing protein n=1 Tax=Chaetomium fimeti TaxID=1854472 RepID=A0AAE0LXR3_9PEZI|nr:hypothetical protein B0H64DRAFT_18948 [Chaetomium fimeti]
MLHGLDDGSNLPIPNRERNNGGSLIVWSGHPQGAALPPWSKPSSEDHVDLLRKLESCQASQPSQPSPGQSYPGQTSPGPSYAGQSGPPPSDLGGERRTSRSRPKLPIIILSFVLFLVIAALIVVGTLLGTRISKLENTIPPLAVATATNSAAGNDNNNNDNNSNLPSSSATDNPNPSSTSTSIPNASYIPPPPAPANIQVTGWTHLGCYYDSEVRVLPEAFVSSVNMTNEACAEHCTSDGRRTRNFGTQVAVQCYCGTATAAVLASRRAPDWMCSRQCGGRWGIAENCGGNWVLSLWERDGDEE